jgi:hypothetical protein
MNLSKKTKDELYPLSVGVFPQFEASEDGKGKINDGYRKVHHLAEPTNRGEVAHVPPYLRNKFAHDNFLLNLSDFLNPRQSMNAIQSDQKREEKEEIPVLEVQRLKSQLPSRARPFEHQG